MNSVIDSRFAEQEESLLINTYDFANWKFKYLLNNMVSYIYKFLSVFLSMLKDQVGNIKIGICCILLCCEYLAGGASFSEMAENLKVLFLAFHGNITDLKADTVWPGGCVQQALTSPHIGKQG